MAVDYGIGVSHNRGSDRKTAAPSLAAFVRFARERHTGEFPDGATRQQIADSAHISIAYLAKLESGTAESPTATVLRSLATSMELSPDETQHLFDLAGRSSENVRVPTKSPLTVAEYRAMVDPDVQMTYQAVNPHLVALLDERWNVLVCNDSYRKAYPGLMDSTNVLSWFFTDPRSRQVMVDWEKEATLTVGWFRGLSARYQDSQWSHSVLDELSGVEEFQQMWSRNHVIFGRDDPWMSLRNDDGTTYTVWVNIYGTSMQGHQLQLFTGVRREP
ncbi:XRE family transcriptional regulator [Rhodococcus sp. SBT000017]|uniref:helix-turn-helix domain-containing protein n=1 Tax=Rhodococcus sp. SBT000017 TaxID=1803385 RepID=UPI000EF8E4C5|nr:helix-turn-helix domain-containing protein [Rhodococcus sp. SBT000017]RMB69769.1 XRE family transcriptional regulator [Rhodococcus sp. SBT000017]